MSTCNEMKVISGDTTQCQRCGMKWDTNDPLPPLCPLRDLEELDEQLAHLERTSNILVGILIVFVGLLFLIVVII